MSKENNKEWLNHLWRKQSTRALLFFNIWGHYHCEMGRTRQLRLHQLFETMEDKLYGPDEIFEKVDSEMVDFLNAFGGLEQISKNFNLFKALLNPYFVDELKNAGSDNFWDEVFSPVFTIGFWLYGLIALYTYLNPLRLSQSAEKCLVLNHNAHEIYGDMLKFLYAVDIYARRQNQTLAANMPKKKFSKLLEDKVKAYQKLRVERNPRFANLSFSQQAENISKDLKNEDMKVAARTIRRKLASLASRT